jgi:hypothetical protein
MAEGLTGRGGMRPSHADREEVIEVLKDAFVDGLLTRDELYSRAGRALSARTCPELAALTADIAAGAGSAHPSAPVRRRPLASPPVAAGICLIITVAAVGVGILLPGDPGRPGPNPWAGLIVFLAVSSLFTALGIMGCAVFTSWDQRLSRRQPPPAGRVARS